MLKRTVRYSHEPLSCIHPLDSFLTSPEALTETSVNLEPPSWIPPDVTDLLCTGRKRQRLRRLWRDFIFCAYWWGLVPPLGSFGYFLNTSSCTQ